MGQSVKIKVDLSHWHRAAGEIPTLIEGVTARAADLLAEELRTAVQVTPGPSGHPMSRSGELGGSIRVIHQASVTGTEVFLAGPTAPYARAMELKRRRVGVAYAWWRPGIAEHRDRFREFWMHLWRQALARR